MACVSCVCGAVRARLKRFPGTGCVVSSAVAGRVAAAPTTVSSVRGEYVRGGRSVGGSGRRRQVSLPATKTSPAYRLLIRGMDGVGKGGEGGRLKDGDWFFL